MNKEKYKRGKEELDWLMKWRQIVVRIFILFLRILLIY